jgi:hypothetical protein
LAAKAAGGASFTGLTVRRATRFAAHFGALTPEPMPRSQAGAFFCLQLKFKMLLLSTTERLYYETAVENFTPKSMAQF